MERFRLPILGVIFVVAWSPAVTAAASGASASREPAPRAAATPATPQETLERSIAALEAEVRQTDRSSQARGEALLRAEARIERLEAMATTGAKQSRTAALVLAFGLLLDVLGALLLAGPSLITKQEDVFGLGSTPPLHDLAMRDVTLEPKMGFLGSLGALFLFSGFVCQFVGTTLSFSTSYGADLGLALVAVVPGTGLLFFFLGLSRDQPRSQKLRILWRNTRRNLLGALRRGCPCDLCGRPVLQSDGEVWWFEETNLPEFPYLHQPYDWHIGHPGCLAESSWFVLPPTSDDRLSVRHASIPEFLNTLVPTYRDWWAGFHAHWAKTRQQPSGESAHQAEFERVLRRAAAARRP